MPDTPTLQEAFGQPTEQRPGCGFPVARLLGLFHVGTGVLLTREVKGLTEESVKVFFDRDGWTSESSCRSIH